MVLYFCLSAVLAAVIVLACLGKLTPNTVKEGLKAFYQNTLIILSSALCLCFLLFAVAEIVAENQLIYVILNVLGILSAAAGIVVYFFRKKEYLKLESNEVKDNE